MFSAARAQQLVLIRAIARGNSVKLLHHPRQRTSHIISPPLKLRCIPHQQRSFSDNLLGHSPMAPTSTPSSASREIPTAQEVRLAGGVWAPTSAKRESLTELKIELAAEEHKGKTLDDFATPLQKLDLDLADGLLFLAKLTDATKVAAVAADSESDDTDNVPCPLVVAQVNDWIAVQTEKLSTRDLTQVQWDEYLNDVSKELEQQLSTIPAGRCLKFLRDFYYDAAPPTEQQQQQEIEQQHVVISSADNEDDPTTVAIRSHAEEAVLRFRLLLAKAAAQHLRESWVILTTVSDQDVDRAAVLGETIENQAKTLNVQKANAVLHSYLTGTCADRVDALWDLLDRDQDGLIDEGEMNTVCNLAIEPVRKALDLLFQDALKAHPVQLPLPPLDDISNDETRTTSSDNTNTNTNKTVPPKPLGWRQRRKQAKYEKRLLKTFQRALRVHFLDEVELPHRLRCSYAWANKLHQNNRIDSVLVDDSGLRKRYVELHPKIALLEFRQVQKEHLTHLDHVATEFVQAFRQDLWIQQGKLRNRRILMRDCTIFLTVVCAVDYVICIL